MTTEIDGSTTSPSTDAATVRRTRTLELAGLWASLSQEELGALAESMEHLKYSAGEAVIRQGDPGERLHIVTAGALEVRIHTSNGVVLPVAQLGNGDCFGEMSLLTGDEASADVVALEDTETLSLDRTGFNKLLDSHAGLLRQFVTVVSRRLKATDEALTRGIDREAELTRFLAEDPDTTASVLVGKDKAARALSKRVDVEAGRRDPLLLRGERGVGKEAVARQIHYRSTRGEGPLLAVDCARIKETRWGDQLFGDFHRKDAKGGPSTVCFMDLAEGGTLLLKNIDLLPPAVIERLDRYLEREGIGGRRR
ncbi:MAG: cyclic nucleotide-binding domain-containing protein, partial [Planctomycetota bacterium]